MARQSPQTPGLCGTWRAPRCGAGSLRHEANLTRYSPDPERTVAWVRATVTQTPAPRRSTETTPKPDFAEVSRVIKMSNLKHARFCYMMVLNGSFRFVIEQPWSRLMSERRELYRSPDGDSWFLGREPENGFAFIIHQPSGPSGAKLSHIELGAFLNGSSKGSPEHQALLRLIGTLVEVPPYAARP